jgi:hypothetical protein
MLPKQFQSKILNPSLSYRGFSLGITYAQQRSARQQRMARMWLTKHVPTKLQLSSQQE